MLSADGIAFSAPGADDRRRRVAVREAVRMVTEKMETFAVAQMAAVAAMSRHGLQGAATAAEQHYRRTVSRNRRRLSAG